MTRHRPRLIMLCCQSVVSISRSLIVMFMNGLSAITGAASNPRIVATFVEDLLVTAILSRFVCTSMS